MMPRAENVGEGKQRGEQLFIICRALGNLNERTVGLRRPNGFTLTAVVVGTAPIIAIDARRLDVFYTKLTRAIRIGEGRENPVAFFDRLDRRADLFHDAHPLVARTPARFPRLRFATIKPEVGSTDARVRYANDRVGGLDDFGIGNGLDADVARRVIYGCFHATFYCNRAPEASVPTGPF